jgi:5-methylthioadenosine/S-adenosylhomocysteine deaminase
MAEEMRKAATFARIAARDINTVTSADLLHAATVGGATALMRDDIGRIAPGKKADLVLVDLENPWMVPARDPLRSFIYHAADRAVRDVFIDGREVVAGGRVVTLDRAGAAERLVAAQARMIEATPKRDYKSRTVNQITPLSLPLET